LGKIGKKKMVKNEQKFAKIRKNVQKSCKNASVLSRNLQK